MNDSGNGVLLERVTSESVPFPYTGILLSMISGIGTVFARYSLAIAWENVYCFVVLPLTETEALKGPESVL